MKFDNLKQVKQFLKLWLYGKTQSHFVLHDFEIDFASISLKRLKQGAAYLAVRYNGTQGFHWDTISCKYILSQWSDPFTIIQIWYDTECKCFYVKNIAVS